MCRLIKLHVVRARHDHHDYATVKRQDPTRWHNRFYKVRTGCVGLPSEVRRMNAEGRKRSAESNKKFRSSNRANVFHASENDRSSGAGETVTPIGNVNRSELPRGMSSPQQTGMERAGGHRHGRKSRSRVAEASRETSVSIHREMRRLPA